MIIYKYTNIKFGRKRTGITNTEVICNAFSTAIKSAKKHISFNDYAKMLNFTLPILFDGLPKELILEDISYLLHIYKNKGPKFLVRYLKATQEAVEHYIFDIDAKQEYSEISIGIDQDGWPKWLDSRLKSNSLATKEVVAYRYINTLCSSRMIITVPTKTNLGSITEPSTVPNKEEFMQLLNSLPQLVNDGDRSFIRNLKIGSEASDDRGDSIKSYTVPKFKVSLKSTPNGTGFFSFHWDRAAIVYHQFVETLSEYAETYFSGDIDEWLDDRVDPYEPLINSTKELKVGKISLTFQSGKLKPRVFAIVDSLTQTLLGPFHDDLMALLRSIPDDGTFEHDAIKQKAQTFHLKTKPFYGFADLSNATDRLPKELYEVIGNSLRPDLGTRWLKLFDRPFHLGKSVTENWDTSSKIPDTIKYQVGQPMGSLSSWPFLAYVHHILIWHSFGSRKRAKGNYQILGDDIVIFNERAYDKYLSLLDTCGMSYTNSISTKGFEFAKRLFYQGEEITGAYTGALWASRKHPEIFALEWSNLQTRGYSAGASFPRVMKSLLLISARRYYRCLLLTQVPRGTTIPSLDIIKWVFSLQERSLCHLEHNNVQRVEEALKAFRQGAALLVRQSFQETLDKAKANIQQNREDFRLAFIAKSGLCKEKQKSIISTAVNEYVEQEIVKIRYLERDLKLSFLKPTDKQLIRPDLPDLPRAIDFMARDKHVQQLKFRAEHQFNIINLLRLR